MDNQVLMMYDSNRDALICPTNVVVTGIVSSTVGIDPQEIDILSPYLDSANHPVGSTGCSLFEESEQV